MQWVSKTRLFSLTQISVWLDPSRSSSPIGRVRTSPRRWRAKDSHRLFLLPAKSQLHYAKASVKNSKLMQMKRSLLSPKINWWIWRRSAQDLQSQNKKQYKASLNFSNEAFCDLINSKRNMRIAEDFNNLGATWKKEFWLTEAYIMKLNCRKTHLKHFLRPSTKAMESRQT